MSKVISVTVLNEKEVDDYECECLNTSAKDGFFPSDIHGKEMEPIAGQWNGFYVCGRCKRISYIDNKTGK